MDASCASAHFTTLPWAKGGSNLRRSKSAACLDVRIGGIDRNLRRPAGRSNRLPIRWKNQVLDMPERALLYRPLTSRFSRRRPRINQLVECNRYECGVKMSSLGLHGEWGRCGLNHTCSRRNP